jgi:hypothetical protein
MDRLSGFAGILVSKRASGGGPARVAKPLVSRRLQVAAGPGGKDSVVPVTEY